MTDQPVSGAQCPTCKDEGRILHIYARGPGDAPGNQMVGCPDCEKGREYNEKIMAQFQSLRQTATMHDQHVLSVYRAALAYRDAMIVGMEVGQAHDMLLYAIEAAAPTNAAPQQAAPKRKDFLPHNQCPSCYWHQGHEPAEWFAEEAKIRGYSAPDCDALTDTDIQKLLARLQEQRAWTLAMRAALTKIAEMLK